MIYDTSCVHKFTSLKPDAIVVTVVIFRHTEAGGQPIKESKEGGAKRIGGRVSHGTHQRKSLCGNGTLGSNHTVKLSKATLRRV